MHGSGEYMYLGRSHHINAATIPTAAVCRCVDSLLGVMSYPRCLYRTAYSMSLRAYDSQEQYIVDNDITNIPLIRELVTPQRTRSCRRRIAQP
jgi:hypothetical protein